MPLQFKDLVPFISLAIYVLLSIIVCCQALSLVKWLIGKAWKILKTIYTKLNGNLTTKLISLSIAGIAVPLIIPSLFQIFLKFTINFFVILFRDLISNSNIVSQTCEYLSNNREIEACFRASVIQVLSALLDSFSKAYEASNAQNFPIGRAIIFLAILVFLSESVHRFRTISNSNVKEKSWLNSIFSGTYATSNILFFSILTASLYLSIASIAAIPSLQDSKTAPEEVSVEKLEQRLNASANQFRRRFATEGDEFNEELNPFTQINDSTKNPLTKLEEYIDTTDLEQDFAKIFIQQGIIAQEELPKEKYLQFNSIIKESLSPVYDAGQSFLGQSKNVRSFLISQTNEFLVETKKEVEELLKAAITEYEFSNVDRKGSRETVEHFLTIVNWFDRAISSKSSQLSSCFSSIQTLDENYENAVQKFNIEIMYIKDRSTAKYILDNLDRYTSSSTEFYWYKDTLDNTKEAQNRAFKECRLLQISSSDTPPKRPDLGANLGPFKFVASWLLQTESLSLALITGLLGFGLLGSACSSFIRERLGNDNSLNQSDEDITDSTSQEPQPLVKDLPKITVIGLSAAILAFLSVVGGLSIFSVGANDPNPYALLLACLVASVFGEDIWDWARYELQKRKKQTENTDTSDEQEDSS